MAQAQAKSVAWGRSVHTLVPLADLRSGSYSCSKPCVENFSVRQFSVTGLQTPCANTRQMLVEKLLVIPYCLSRVPFYIEQV